MKRVVLVILALAAVAPFAPSTAGAAAPCRDRIYNDWYHDGKIATTYSIACYRDALKNVPTDAREYSSLADDIRSAMQGALAAPERPHEGPGPDRQGRSSALGAELDEDLPAAARSVAGPGEQHPADFDGRGQLDEWRRWRCSDAAPRSGRARTGAHRGRRGGRRREAAPALADRHEPAQPRSLGR